MPNNEDDKTKKVKINKRKRRPQSQKTNKRNIENQNSRKRTPQARKKKNKKEHPKLMIAIKIFIIIFLLLAVIGAGIVAGMFFGLFGTDFEIDKSALKIDKSNTVVIDEATGELLADLSADEKRKIIKLEDMADYLPKAYIAIEDERFYKHSGVDFKRTAGAIRF